MIPAGTDFATEGAKAGEAPPPGPLYGLLAELTSPDELVSAVRRVRSEGYREIDAYTPFPIEEVIEAVAPGRSPLPWIVLIGGVIGGTVGYFLQTYTAVVSYPLNIGGRPLDSWPMFIVITFELTILFAVLSAVFWMFALNRLPMPYHPVFNVDRFRLASRERYFLLIKATDARFDPRATRELLEGVSREEVRDVPA